MKKKLTMLFGVAVGLLLLSACSHTAPVMIAKYTEAEPDARLQGEAWKHAPEYHFQPYTAGAWYDEIECANGMRGRVLEPGTVKLLWNEKYLYVGMKMEDSDLVDEAERDQTHLFTQADAVELFIKPENFPHYWEIYGSVNAKKTCYFFPGRGRLGLSGNNGCRHGVEVQVVSDGTLNFCSDRDRSWTMLLKVPTDDLTRHGAKWGKTERWLILLVRHNYSVYLPSREVSAYPAFQAKNPHSHEEYAVLVFEN